MKLTLVRHTKVDVEPGICYGQTDVKPAQSFTSEAESVKIKLTRLHFDITFTSPLSRCTMLADYCGHKDAIRDNRLKEMNFGEWEMKRYDSITDPRLREWYADYINVRPTGGESFMEQQLRVMDFYKSLRNSDYESALIFTHAGVMMHTLLLSGLASIDNVFSIQPKYGEIIEIELSSLSL